MVNYTRNIKAILMHYGVAEFVLNFLIKCWADFNETSKFIQ